MGMTLTNDKIYVNPTSFSFLLYLCLQIKYASAKSHLAKSSGMMFTNSVQCPTILCSDFLLEFFYNLISCHRTPISALCSLLIKFLEEFAYFNEIICVKALILNNNFVKNPFDLASKVNRII